jgi:hypothetical protein
VLALLALDEKAELSADGLATTGKIAVRHRWPSGTVAELVEPVRP